MTDENGRYELSYTHDQLGAELGLHIVRIVRGTDPNADPWAEYDFENQQPNRPPPLPARYNSDSTLRREVPSGRSTIDFELKSTVE